MSDSYLSPAGRVEDELIVKKSRFITWIAPVENREQAMELLEEAREKYPDARHHCWAYVLGNPSNAASAAANDDREPSGTAGKPILNVIQHKNIGDIMVVVIRYFGGIKLGAGGLVRAYSGATQQATEKLELVSKYPKEEIQVFCQYNDEPLLRRWIEEQNAELLDANYTDRVELIISAQIAAREELAAMIAGWTDCELVSPPRRSQ